MIISTAKVIGFSLIELIITIAIASIILTLAAPSFQTALLNNRMIAQNDALINALNYARSTALTQNINSSVCPASALGSAACGSNWSTGWIIITEPAVGTSALLQIYLTGTNDPILSSNANSVLFNHLGLANTPAHFKLCDSRGGNFASSVLVSATGFIESGINIGLAVWDNSALSCP